MSSSGPSFSVVDTLNNFQSRFGTLQKALIAGFGTIIVTFLAGTAEFIQAVQQLFIKPLVEMGNGIAGFMQGLIGGAGDIIQQGARTTVQSIAPGQTWAVGPLTFGFSILAMGAGLYAFAWLMSRAETSDTIPFTFTDLPLIGADEEDDDD